jgi:hypothetical protein
MACPFAEKATGRAIRYKSSHFPFGQAVGFPLLSLTLGTVNIQAFKELKISQKKIQKN